jgi:hypothetical protein
MSKLDVLEPLDGPTKEFRDKHEITSRSKVAGKRRRLPLEVLLDSGDITPEEYDAGDKFGRAYNVGSVGSSASALYRSGGKGSGDNSLEWRLDQGKVLREASVALNAEHGWVGGVPPDQFMAEICAIGTSFKALAERIGIHDERVRTQASKMLQTLAGYFRRIDRQEGVSVTPGTKDQVKRRLDPDEDR